jgi:hypothetical protein
MTRRLAIAALLASALTACQIGGDTTRFTPPASCSPVSAACSSDAGCCSYGCVSGICVANPQPGGICRTSDDCGNAVDATGSHSMLCKVGSCTVVPPAGLCRDNGDVCYTDASCCGGTCAGGSGVAKGTCGPNHAPILDLGPDFTVPYHKAVTLRPVAVSDPDGDTLIYGWTLVPPLGSTATLSSATAATPTFTPDITGVYQVQLTVTDGDVTRVKRLTATDNLLITAVNTPPVAYAGADVGHASRNTLQTLAGTANDPDGDPLTCKWSVTSPSGATQLLSGPAPCAGAVGASFTPPIGLASEGDWIATLEVSDGVSTVTDTATFTCVNDAPVADAGPDQVWNLGVAPPNPSIPLRGAMTDVNGDPASTWTWTIVAAPAGSAVTSASIANASSATAAAPAASFVPDVTGRYIVQLEVCDRPGSCTTDTADVDVYRPIREFTDGRLLNATAYAHGADKIALAGVDPLDPQRGKVWLYDPANGTELASPSLDAIPDTIAVAADGSWVVAGSSLWLWTVKFSGASPTVPPTATKIAHALGALGSIALVEGGKNQAMVFPLSSTTTYFSRFDYVNASALTSCGFVGNVGRVDKEGANLYVLQTGSSPRITRYQITNQGNFGLTSYTTVFLDYYGAPTISNIWISRDSAHLFTSSGDIRAASSLAATSTLGLAPSWMDSLPDSQAIAVTSTIARFNTGLARVAGGDDQLPPWGISGTPHAVSVDSAFLRTDPMDPTKTIRYAVVHTTDATPQRSGVVTFP